MPSTLSDFGRNSEQFGDIPFYYAFPIKFWFGQEMLIPEDVLTWCRENCLGFYKVYCYTHKDSKPIPGSKKFLEKIMYVDKIYLEKEEDAALIKLTFEVKDQQVKRPRLKVDRAPYTKRGEKRLDPNSPEGITAATRRHAARMAQKAQKASEKKAAKTAKEAA